MRRHLHVAAVICAVPLLLTACTGDGDPDVHATRSSSPTAAPPSPVAVVHEDRSIATIAQVDGDEVELYDAPSGEAMSIIVAEDVLTVPESTPFTFLVRQSYDDWLELYLPVRPNGSTGWVHRDTVILMETDFRIEISLTDFRMKVWQGERLLLSAEVGIGQQDRPTPGGVYYVRELLEPPDPGGVYGPYAYGLSGYSPVLDEFQGGDAIIGVHGTNDDSSFGGYVSSGCVRVPNAVITRMVEDIGLPVGTPVYISDDAAPLT